MRANSLSTPGESSSSIIRQQNREYEQSLQRDRLKVLINMLYLYIVWGVGGGGGGGVGLHNSLIAFSEI